MSNSSNIKRFVRKQTWICRFWRCAYLGLMTLLVLESPVAAQVRQIRRVVILNDLGIISSPGFAEVDQAIFAGLQKSPYQIELYHESLEVSLFPDEVSQRRFRKEFMQRYSDRRPDVIIAVGSTSFKFVAESQERFLRNTPIIFCAILGKIPEELRPDMQFTGVLGRLHPMETLTAALHMLPNTKHVVVIGGVGKFDQGFEDIAKQSFQNLESKLEFTYLMNLSMPALLELLKHLPSDTIVYHTAITKDAAGQRFIDSAQSIPLVTGAANAPIFVMDDVDLRGGTVGGDLVNWSDDGHVAAEMAVRVLNGEKTQDIPIVTSNEAYMFDWHALQRWGIKESSLPPGSIVLNREPSFWEVYKLYVIGGALVVLAQAIVILALMWQRARRRKAELELMASNERLRFAMEVLCKSEERMQGIITSAMEAIIVVDQAQEIMVFNPAAEKMFVCSSEDAIGAPIDQFIAHGILPGPREQISPVGLIPVTNLAAGAIWPLWGKKKNGERFPMEASVSQLGIGEQKLTTVIIRDVTERKQAEEARFRHTAILESSEVAIISLDLNGTIVSWNIGAQRTYGYAEAEVLGRPINIIIPNHLREEAQQFLLRVGSGEPIEHHETVRVTKDGREINVSVTVSPLRDWTGQIVGASKVARDITFEKQAEEALRESEQRFRLVADKAPVMIWMSGTDKLRTFFSQTWLNFTGRSASEEAGDGWTEGVHSEDLDCCLKTYEEACDAQKPFEMEYRLRRADGEYRWVVDLGIPRLHADGSFAGYIGSCMDVTERKLAQEALSSVSRRLIEAHEEERTWIARELHDDVNQRLAMLAVNLDVLKREVPASAGGAVRQLSDATDALKELGRDVQALSHRLHSSKLEYLGLAAAVTAFCRDFAEGKGLQIDLDCDAVPRTVPAEISLCLFRVLQEALQNANKHSGSNHYQVLLRYVGNNISLTVSDSGIGFDLQQALRSPGLGVTSMQERLKLVGGELAFEQGTPSGTVVRARVPVPARVMSVAAGRI